MTWTAKALGLTNLAAKERGFEARWAVVRARYDACDARLGPANRITVNARAQYEATVRRHYGLTADIGESRDQIIRARHRVRVRNGVAA